MKVRLINLGCKVNRVETDSIAAAYLARGAEIAQGVDADIVVVNTCTVTGEAERKTRKTIRKALRDNPSAQVLVTGCAAAIDPDFFESIDNRIAVVDKGELLGGQHGQPVASAALSARQGEGFPTRVGVKAQDGCNHSCTYCIVHVARGKAWSRPYGDLAAEVVALAQGGVKEIVLTGIDLGSYRQSDPCMKLSGMLSALLADLDKVGCTDTRLRVGSIEPCSLDSNFIQLLASSDGRVCRHLHLPLQSGSSKVLKEMNRPYSAEYFDDLVDRLNESVPGISLTTDVIVGFPGETDADFQETLRLCERAAFSKLHVFRYSKRRGTPAAERADQIDPAVKEQRANELAEFGDSLRLSFARRMVGSPASIVVEQQGIGMTESYFKVALPDNLQPGSLVRLPLTSVDSNAIFSV